MANQNFIHADEIAEELGVSKAYAYKIVHRLNDELKAKGYVTISGRVSRKYFEEKFYGMQSDDKKGA
ncbi:HTH domain-containing protein [Eubacterium coprostanoligenes]|uniref:HTH domain-containing protein n=1 Tax=Eubacterium coprostanoligenes TaxID=290054 RepID=UPI00235287FD|nr:HTH domain-containing protein [Eubacterium coprostanoligenes]MCI6254746.1 helix-turn-helix domain-containing protein [Eubacterium coprostanoligenes]MDO4154061.1 HTH domain-containing protein [Clostridia bacterium]MDY5400889.1 HTH domain-containing protein [Eubacterium coprostanoligenes]